MISRYKNNKTKKTSDGRLVYKSKIYPNIPLRDDDIYVVTDIGDRLDTLAYRYYNNASLWWIIATANNMHDAPLGIREGIVLRIPQNYIQITNKFNK